MIMQFVKTNILSKKLRNFLTIFSILVSVMLIISVGNITSQIKSNVVSNASNYDILVGSSGSPTQLILSTLFFYDSPISNINIDYMNRLEKDNRVVSIVPIGMGDNYNGYRLIGTSNAYFNNNIFKLKSGKTFENTGEVVLGSTVARVTGLKIGDTFSGMHGLTTEDLSFEDHAHADFKYTVVGILDATRTPNDTVIFTPIESLWHVHGVEEENEQEEHEEHEQIVTAILVKTKGLTEQTVISKELNENADIQAINPASTLRRLLTTLSIGETIVTIVAYVSILLSVIVLFTTMLSASIERRKDISILRALGANRKTVFTTILLETLVIAIIGALLGFVLAHIGIGILGNYTSLNYGIDINGYSVAPSEIYVLILAIILSTLAGVIPGVMVYKTDATKYLK